MPHIGLEQTPTLDARLEQQLRLEFRQYQALKRSIAKLKERADERRERIIALRRESGVDSLTVDGCTVALVKGKLTFDRKKFVTLGGDLSVYDAAKTRGNESERVTLPSESNDSDG